MSHDHSFAVSDVAYNVITTLSNLLQSEEVLMKYATDAQEAGDQEAELQLQARTKTRNGAAVGLGHPLWSGQWDRHDVFRI